MKKLIATLMSVTMLLALASCGDEGDTATSSAAASAAPVVSATPVPTVAPVSVEPIPTQEPQPAGPANIALEGTAEDNGCTLYNAETMSAAALIDGDTATEAWQPHDWNEDGDYVIVNFAEATKIDCVVIYGEAATFMGMADGGYELYVKSGDDWNKVEDAESDYAEGVDTVTFAEAIEAEGVKVVLLDSNSYEDDGSKVKYAPKLNEIQVYAAAAEEEAPVEETSTEEAPAESEAE